MNSIISKVFILLNEVFSWVIFVLNLFIGLFVISSSGFLWGLLYLAVSNFVLIVLFGIISLFIESHKALLEIRDKLLGIELQNFDKHKEVMQVPEISPEEMQKKTDIDARFERWLAEQDPPIVAPTPSEREDLRKAFLWKLRQGEIN